MIDGEEWMVGGGEGLDASRPLTSTYPHLHHRRLEHGWLSHVRMACKLGSWWQLANTTHTLSFSHRQRLT